MNNLIGQSLGRYHIVEQLGEGGMATVYKAYDTRLEREVAVKVLRTEQFAPVILDRILKRFEREAKSLAKLSHPNIVNVHDYGDHEGLAYLVMDYLPGGTLKDKLGKPMPWQEACRLLLPISEALEYAHEHSILHRDVKPSNILLTERGQPLLTDFGIAKILDLEGGQTLTGTGVGIGTPEYMSPEQGLGKPINPSTDVYSLGVVLYELITGRKPYIADTPMAVVVKHMNDPLPRPAEFVPNLPPLVENLLLKALAKNPEERFQNMTEFSAALEKLVMSDPSGTATLKAVTGRAEERQEPVRRVSEQSTIDQGMTGATVLQEADRVGPPPVQTARPKYPPPPKPKKKNWLIWVAGAGVLAVFVCLLLVMLLFGNDIAAALFPTDTPTRTFTPSVTNTPTRTPTRTFTPTPEFVYVAIYNFSSDGDISYWRGGIQNVYSEYEEILWSDPWYRFSVSVITDLSYSTLSGFSRLILPDNAVPDYYLTDVQSWLRSGGKSIIAVDSAITYVSYAGLMWEGSEGYDGYESYWDYNASSADLSMVSGPLTYDIFTPAILSSVSGDAQMFRDWLPYDAVALAESYSNPSMIYAACRNIPTGGTVFVLGPFESPEADLFDFIRNMVYAPTCE